jgi:hypothetical protein
MTSLLKKCTFAFVISLAVASFADAQEKSASKASTTARKASRTAIPDDVRRAATELQMAMDDDGLSYTEFRRSLVKLKTEIKLAVDRKTISPLMNLTFMTPIIKCEGIVTKWGDGERDSPNGVWRELSQCGKKSTKF